MAFSFVQIEKDKSRSIGFVFLFLILFYFLIAIGLYWCLKAYFFMETSRDGGVQSAALSLSSFEILFSVTIALIVGVFHWFASISNVVPRILKLLNAKDLDPKDTYHQRLINILEEVSIATGGIKVHGVVVPTPALNAFALSDFHGNNVIGVTEGLLARLNRAQLEAVIGHEMAHVATGDCVSTTTITALFDIYSGMASLAEQAMSEQSGRRSRGGGWVITVILFLNVTMFIASLFRMFISREREFRADAIAVRLTRDPLSLAEALYIISRRWRGHGIPGEGLESIFILRPEFNAIDEEESFMADLFSTHPPVRQRLAILLSMAHSNMETLENKLKVHDIAQVPAPESPMLPNPPQITEKIMPILPVVPTWEVFNQGQWHGPYSIEDVRKLGWIDFDSFIRNASTKKIARLCDADDVKKLNQAWGVDQDVASTACPACQIPLSEDMYKGMPICRCFNCGGVLVKESDVSKMLARDDYIMSTKVAELGEAILKMQDNLQIKNVDLKTANLYDCPRCKSQKRKLLRSFYTLQYPVEIDRCISCQSLWFDRFELEVLQYLVLKNIRKLHEHH